MKGEERARTF